MSTGVLAMKMPESPPMTNMDTKATAFSIGTVNWMRPPHSVPSQLNVLMAEVPEQVLPQQRLAPARRREPRGAQRAVEEQNGHRRGQRGQRQQQEDGRDEQRPHD